MEDGAITIWNTRDIVQRGKVGGAAGYGGDSPLGLIHQEEPIFDSPIICAEWNNIRPNLLGFGCNEVLIMDIGKGFTHDDVFVKPGQKNPHINSYVTAVTWNK